MCDGVEAGEKRTWPRTDTTKETAHQDQELEAEFIQDGKDPCPAGLPNSPLKDASQIPAGSLNCEDLGLATPKSCGIVSGIYGLER